MPLGLLAKDSIQDLTALARGGDDGDGEPTGLSGQMLPSIPGAVADVEILLPPQPDDVVAAGVDDGEESASTSTTHSGNKLDDPTVNSGDGASGVGSGGGYDANPQQAQEEDARAYTEDDRRAAEHAAAHAGAYAGFRGDYYYGQDDAAAVVALQHHPNSKGASGNLFAFSYYDYASPVAYLGEKPESKRPRSLLDCIFPCLFGTRLLQDDEDDHDGHQREDFPSLDSSSPSPNDLPRSSQQSSSSRDEDEVSCSSDVLGEKLSDKERQAVLARLGLAQPSPEDELQEQQRRDQQHLQQALQPSDYAADFPPTAPLRNSERTGRQGYHHPKGGLLNGIPTYDGSPLQEHEGEGEDALRQEKKPLRGILKRRSTFLGGGSSSSLKDAAQQSSSSASAQQQQQQLQQQQQQRRSLFPSYTVSPPKGRRADLHVSFAPMARVVTVKSKNDMVREEKADIWWQKPDYDDFRRTGRIITRAMLEGGSEIWLQDSVSNDAGSDSDDEDENKKKKKQVKDEHRGGNYASGDKWWHRFGHSRRGLEHVVSIEEGRQRQQNVRNAIHAVLEEQLRQKRYRREDHEKLRIVSLNHTSWARDLALASGHSDADAVKSSFSQDRKTREFYLLKMAKKTPVTATSSRRIPEFMQPVLAVGLAAASSTSAAVSPRVKAHKLDANTAAQIQFRKDLEKQEQGLQRQETPPAYVNEIVV